MARTSALEETYEALVGNDGSLEGLTQNLFTSSSDLKARQDIICEQVCITYHLNNYSRNKLKKQKKKKNCSDLLLFE